MRMVDADALAKEAGKLWSEMPDGEELSKELMKTINHAPTVDAVPLEPLCEWLEENAALPTEAYMISGMAWKRKLTKWMEGLDAADRCR